MTLLNRRQMLRGLCGSAVVTSSGCTQLPQVGGNGGNNEIEWPVPGGDLQNRRRIPTKGPAVDSAPEQQWSGEIGSQPPVVKDEAVFVAQNSPKRTGAYDAGDGTVKWESYPENSPGAPLAPPATDGERLYTTNLSPEILAQSTESGEEVWVTAPQIMTMNGASGHAPVVDGKRVYAIFSHPTERRGELLAVNRDDGKIEWSCEIASHQHGWVAVAGEIVLTKAGSSLLAIDAKSGEQVWELAVPTDSSLYSTSPSVADGLVYAATRNGRIVAASVDTGEIEWLASVESNVQSGKSGEPLAVGTDCLLIATESGRLHAFDRSDGTERWQSTLGEVLPTQPAVSDSTAYVGNLYAGEVYAVNMETGNPRWSIKADYVTYLPLVITNQRLYLPGKGVQAWQ